MKSRMSDSCFWRSNGDRAKGSQWKTQCPCPERVQEGRQLLRNNPPMSWLLEFPSVVNFINVLRASFLYEILAPKFTKLCFGFEFFWHQNISKKCAHKILMKLTPFEVDFTHMFMIRSFYMYKSQKCKKTVKSPVSFCTFGISLHKSCSKTLVKLTPVVNFISI